jgi:hypothetical protein
LYTIRATAGGPYSARLVLPVGRPGAAGAGIWTFPVFACRASVNVAVRWKKERFSLTGVQDPFAGSGTTLVVAKKLGRKWIGFELSPQYATQAQARLDAVSEGQALEGAEEPKVSAPATPRRRVTSP